VTERERAVLLADDERIRAALERAGFEVATALTAAAAAAEVEAEKARLFAVGEGSDPRAAAVLRALGGARRRAIFVAAFGSGFRTGDREAAFRESANLVVGTGDLEGLASLLGAARDEEERFTRRLREAFAEHRAALGAAL